MDVLGDAIARDRRSDATALRVPSAGRSYDYRQFCTTAWRVGNLLRHHGVRGGDRVVVADDPRPAAVFSLYGVATLGGVVQFASPRTTVEAARVLVAPTAEVERYDGARVAKRLAYGDRPADPSVAHYDRDVPSENPTEPPDQVDPGAALLATPGGTLTHRDVLSAATTVAEERDLSPGSTLSVDGPLAHPGVVVAGLVAPIVAGAVACIGPDVDGDVDPDAVLDESGSG